MTDATAHLRRLIEPTAKSLGFELVRVAWTGRGVPPVLQIMAERPDGTMVVEDCAELSHAISALLDVEDPIAGDYVLEVSSPGIDRPLVRQGDYERFKGHVAKLEMRQMIEGRKRFRGRLGGLRGEDVILTTDDGEVALPLGDIDKARLVLTDDLVAASMKQRS